MSEGCMGRLGKRWCGWLGEWPRSRDCRVDDKSTVLDSNHNMWYGWRKKMWYSISKTNWVHFKRGTL